MKPETRQLKALLAGLGIPRAGSGASCLRAGVVVATILTDEARRIAVEQADRIVAEGFTVLLNTYRCGCPARVVLCSSSAPSLRRTVQNWRHDCPVGGELLPVTAIDWLASAVPGGAK